VSNPLRVLLVAYKIRPNMGSEDGSGYYIAAELACRGFDVTLVTRANNVPALRSDPAFDGVELVGIDVPKPLGSFKRGGRGIILYYYLWQLVVGRAVRRLVRARQFDVLHQLNFHTDWAPHFLSGNDVPVVWGPIAHHRRAPSNFFAEADRLGRTKEAARFAIKQAFWRLDPFLRRAARETQAVLYANDDLAPPFAAAAPRLRPYAGSFAAGEPVPRERSGEPFRALFVGRFVALKGLLPAIESFAAFVKDVDDAPRPQLVVVGAGAQSDAARELADRLGIDTEVRFEPWVPQDELRSLYESSSVLLYPSVEAQGLVVAEALAAGLPTITLAGTGPSILAGSTGWHVALDGAAEGLRVALTEAHDEWRNDRLERRRNEARQRYVDTLDWPRIVDDLQVVYQEVTAGNRDAA